MNCCAKNYLVGNEDFTSRRNMVNKTIHLEPKVLIQISAIGWHEWSQSLRESNFTTKPVISKYPKELKIWEQYCNCTAFYNLWSNFKICLRSQSNAYNFAPGFQPSWWHSKQWYVAMKILGDTYLKQFKSLLWLHSDCKCHRFLHRRFIFSN